MIYLIKKQPTERQIQEMLEAHGSFIKLAVDVEREVLSGGGGYHRDCEAVLLEDGSRQENIWGADWIPKTKRVRFEALINIRPKTNRSMVIQDPSVRKKVEVVVRRLFDYP